MLIAGIENKLENFLQDVVKENEKGLTSIKIIQDTL